MKSKIFQLIAILAGSAWLLLANDVQPIACNMKALTAGQRTQLGRVGEHVISAITMSQELDDGYAFRVDPAKASLIDVAVAESVEPVLSVL